MDREQPYLSIVVTSRNDGHGGSPLSRTQTFLDSLSDQCRRHSLAAELIFVEWNPPADRPRLCHALREPAQPSPLDVRFIEVPAEIHSELANHDKLGLFQMIAKNVGIRRSRGEFVLATNIDIIFSEELIALIARRELRSDSFYVVQRHDLGVNNIPDGLSGSALMDFARQNLVRINYQQDTLPADAPPPDDKDGYLHLNACGDFTLMSREVWGCFGGYAEMQLFSMHIDSIGLFSARASGLKQCPLKPPLNIFHIEHGDGWDKASNAIIATKPMLSYHCDCKPCFGRTMKTGVAPMWNDSDWGYEGVNFRECGFSGEYDAPAPGAMDAARERYRLRSDQEERNQIFVGRVRNTPDDLVRLERLAAHHSPDAVATFGCDDSARLSALTAGAGNAPFFRCGGFDIEKMDFPAEFGGKRMFVLIDSSELTDAGVDNVVARVLPNLADGSLVLFDNVWHSPQLLASEIAGTVFRDRILPRLDVSRTVRYRFNAYHEGGSLIGLSGITVIAEYINSNTIRPCLASRRKGIWFVVDRSAKKTEWPGIGHPFFERGECIYSPFHGIMRMAAEEIAPGKMIAVLNALVDAGMERNVIEEARAICLAAAGSAEGGAD